MAGARRVQAIEPTRDRLGRQSAAAFEIFDFEKNNQTFRSRKKNLRVRPRAVIGPETRRLSMAPHPPENFPEKESRKISG
jgi:hypothetical protein